MTRKDSFTPQWFEGALPKRSYRSAFKWGAPEAYKHPNPRLYALMKETFDLGNDHFETPQELGLDEVTADAPISLEPSQIRFFRDLLGDENVSDDVYSRLRVSYGKTMFDALRLRERTVENLPDLVLHPRDRNDVEKIVRYCHEQEIPLYTFGAGSSVTRGTECFRAGVSIHLGTHMKRVLSLNAVNQTVTVEPGILGPDLEEALNQARERFNAPHAYTCGHFPQSRNRRGSRDHAVGVRVPVGLSLVGPGGNRRGLQALRGGGNSTRHDCEPARLQKGRALPDAGHGRRRRCVHRHGQTPSARGL
jgi:alkyldihydroxyacetonephosphate synthase